MPALRMKGREGVDEPKLGLVPTFWMGLEAFGPQPLNANSAEANVSAFLETFHIVRFLDDKAGSLIEDEANLHFRLD